MLVGTVALLRLGILLPSRRHRPFALTLMCMYVSADVVTSRASRRSVSSERKVFTVALYLLWLRYLEAVPGVQTQLYADSLKGASACPDALLEGARCSHLSIRLVGQEAAL